MFKTVFERHAPLKKKCLELITLITKERSTATMLKSKLRKRFLKDKNRRIEVQIQKTKKRLCIFTKKSLP